MNLDQITAMASDVRRGKIFVDQEGEPLTGTMAEKGAQTFTPGRFNQTIGSGQYLAGVQTIQGEANLLAHYIKKGVTIFGVTGTWDGFVADAQDMYYMGSNPAGFKVYGRGSMESNMIRTVINPNVIVGKKAFPQADPMGESHIYTTKDYNLTPYHGLQVTGYTPFDNNVQLKVTAVQNGEEIIASQVNFAPGNFTAQVNIGNMNLTCQIEIDFMPASNYITKWVDLDVHRVRLV